MQSLRSAPPPKRVDASNDHRPAENGSWHLGSLGDCVSAQEQASEREHKSRSTTGNLIVEGERLSAPLHSVSMMRLLLEL
jgi:hypothetical protein